MEYNVIASLRLDKMNLKGFCPICINVYQGEKKILKVSIRQSVSPDLWNANIRRVDKKHPNATLLNAIIEKEISNITVKVLENQLLGNLATLPEMLQLEKIKDISFYEFAEKQIKEKNYAKETRRAYHIYLGKMKGYKQHLKLSDIKYQFLQGYEAHLRNVLKNENNTVWGNMKFINTMISDAVKFKYIKENPFDNYKRPGYIKPKKDFLTIPEIDKIVAFEIGTKDDGLRHIARYFLFMCYTGLRYSDAVTMKPEDIVNDQLIIKETQKTKQVTNLFINDKVRPLLTYVLATPIGITQVDFNRRIKLIAAHCGIIKKVSSHTGRHSFGATLAASGVSQKVAQGLLAHGSEASTRIYYQLDNQVLHDAMKKL